MSQNHCHKQSHFATNDHTNDDALHRNLAEARSAVSGPAGGAS